MFGFNLQVEEGKLAGLNAVLVDEAAGKVAAKDGAQVALRHARDDGLETNLLQQQLRKSILENTVADSVVGPQIRLLELLVELSDGNRELVRQDRAGLASLLVLAPDGLKLEASVLADLGLDFADVVLVELGRLASLGVHAHVLLEALIVKRQRSQDLQGRGGDTTLVGRSVLVEDATRSLKAELSILSNEQVGTLNNVGDGGLAILDQAVNRDQINGLGTTTARHESVGHASVTEMVGVAEDSAVGDDLAGRERHVAVFAENAVTVLGNLADVVLADHGALLSQANELVTVETVRVSKDTGAIDNGGPGLVAEKNLVAAQIAIGATSLHLADLGGVKLELTVDSLDVLTHGQGSHTVFVVRDTTKLGGLSSEERLPPGSATDARVLGSPVDEVGSVLVRAHEQDLLLAVEVHDRILDPGSLGRQEEIQNGVDVLLKGLSGLVLLRRVEENDTLGTALRNILVLALLGAGKTVVLIEQVACVDAVGLLAARLDDTDTATGDVLEAEVETARLGADNEEHAVQRALVFSLREERGVETEAQGDLGGGEVVGLEDGVVEDAESSHDHLLVLVGDSLGDSVLELLVGQNGNLGGGGVAAILDTGAQMNVGKRGVQGADQLGVRLDDLQNVVGSEGLGTETALELGKQSSLTAVVDVKDLRQRDVLGAKTVEEVLNENPSRVGVDGLLEAELAVGKLGRESVLRQTVEQGDLLDNLSDRLLHRGEVAILGAGGAQVDGHDGDAVGELLNVLSRRSNTVVMVQIGEGREHATGSASAEGNN